MDLKHFMHNNQFLGTINNIPINRKSKQNDTYTPQQEKEV